MQMQLLQNLENRNKLHYNMNIYILLHETIFS